MLNVTHHYCSSFLVDNSLYSGVNEIINFLKLIWNLNKMLVANLGKQHHRFLDSYFKISREYLCLFGGIRYYFIPSILLELVVYIFKLILLMFTYSLDNITTLRHLSY
jgi:hypothetical protein